jgi:DNA replication protein
MAAFKGFPEGKSRLVPIPAAFFTELLPQMDSLCELKLVLYVFWRLEAMEGPFRCLRRTEIEADQDFVRSLDAPISEALASAVQRGVLLHAVLSAETGQEDCYFLNSPRGRAALRALENGQWRPAGAPQPTPPLQEQTNIFRLYEQHFGPLTPMVAETLGEAQDTYPAQWIEDAIRIAVEKDKRNWHYVSAILEKWLREGRHGRKEKPEDRQDTAESRRRYVEGEFSDFVEH